MKKENDKFVELSEDLKNYQCHDLLSLVYSLIVIVLFAYNYSTSGIDFDRKGTKTEKNIIILGITWYSFDLVLKYFDGVHKWFVWIHHATTISSMLATGYSEDTYCFGATALFINDAIHIFLVISRTYENINYPQRKLKYQVNFSLLVVFFVLSRVIGNHWLIYKGAMTSKVPFFIILGNAPTVAFGTVISLQLLSKFWKHIPHWCRDPEKMHKNKVWSEGRKMFQMYQKNGGFGKAINS
mmetsp:Transcript_20472/g.18116  ORF Transcript_20472/g.18116 Transcript_20472/m.18116 type:complete len:240 (-) Transcript_20472:105-824(-)